MKSKYLLFVVSACLICCLGARVHGQIADSLKPAFSQLDEKHDWKSPEIGEALKHAAEHPSAPEDALTAKVMLVSHLISLNTKESLAEAFTLASGVVRAAPDTWQGALARFYVASIYGLQGKADQQLVAAKAALAGIDFDALEKSKDPHFVKLQSLFGTMPSDIQDALRLMVAEVYIRKNNIKEADSVVSEIKNPAMREAVSSHIKAEKQGREEAAAAAKTKPTPSPKSR
jgi:hypothetical protein